MDEDDIDGGYEDSYSYENTSGGYSMSGGSGLIGGIIGAIHNRSDTLSGRRDRRDDRQAQYDFAQNAIRWKVADAQAAGIHPLFGLGASPASFQPVGGTMGDTSYASELGRGIESLYETDAEADKRIQDDATHKAQIRVLESEANRNDATADATRASTVQRAAQLSNQLRSPPSIIYPKGQVNPPQHQAEIFRTPLGEISADKKFADAEEAERRYGDIAQEVFGLANAVSDIWRSVQGVGRESEKKYPEVYQRR